MQERVFISDVKKFRETGIPIPDTEKFKPRFHGKTEFPGKFGISRVSEKRNFPRFSEKPVFPGKLGFPVKPGFGGIRDFPENRDSWKNAAVKARKISRTPKVAILNINDLLLKCRDFNSVQSLG